MDAVSLCPMLVGNACVRADSCVVMAGDPIAAQPGCYAGSFSCTCGEGPPCEPGYVCARPSGDLAPRRCVCGWAP